MKKAYTLLTVLLPILGVYASPISWFDLGTFLVIIFAIFCLFDKNAIIKISPFLGVLLVYTILTTGLNLMLPNSTKYSGEFSIIMRMVRFVVMLVVMLGIGYTTYFDFDLTMKYLRRVTLIVGAYAILQLLFFYATGLKLINVFGPTKQGIMFDSMLGEYETTYRPPSLFLEPSSVAYYVMPYLCYALFHKYIDQKDKKQSYIYAAIISVGVLCTTSGQGVLCVFALWMIWLFYYLITNKIQKGLIVAIVFIIAAFVILSNERVAYTLERIFISENGGSNAIDARYEGYEAFARLPMLFKIIGMGYGNYSEKIYYSSFADILFCTGILGCTLVLILYGVCFAKGTTYQKMIVIATLILMFGGGVYTAALLCFYLPVTFWGKVSNDRRLK